MKKSYNKSKIVDTIFNDVDDNILAVLNQVLKLTNKDLNVVGFVDAGQILTGLNVNDTYICTSDGVVNGFAIVENSILSYGDEGLYLLPYRVDQIAENIVLGGGESADIRDLVNLFTKVNRFNALIYVTALNFGTAVVSTIDDAFNVQIGDGKIITFTNVSIDDFYIDGKSLREHLSSASGVKPDWNAESSTPSGILNKPFDETQESRLKELVYKKIEGSLTVTPISFEQGVGTNIRCQWYYNLNDGVLGNNATFEFNDDVVDILNLGTHGIYSKVVTTSSNAILSIVCTDNNNLGISKIVKAIPPQWYGYTNGGIDNTYSTLNLLLTKFVSSSTAATVVVNAEMEGYKVVFISAKSNAVIKNASNFDITSAFDIRPAYITLADGSTTMLYKYTTIKTATKETYNLI